MPGPEVEDPKTRAERAERLKETAAEFGKLIQGLNRLGRQINLIIYKPVIDENKIGRLEEEYSSVCDELARVYNQISDLTFGEPPENVVKKFEKIDSDSQQLLATIGVQRQKAHEVSELERSHSEEQSNLSKLCSQMVLGRLPAPEPDVFSGDALEFTAWFNAFKTLISSRSIPDSESIFYLNKYLSGDAKSCVKGFLSLSTSEAYTDAIAMLKDRYGSDFVVANAFRQKLKNWKKISNEDFVGLRHFSDFLCHVQTAKKTNASLSCLDDEQENRNLLYKIPDFCHKRWARKVSEASIDKKPYPNFDDFVKLIRIESDIVNNPVTCIKSSNSSSSQDKQSNRKQVHTTQSSSEKSSSVSCYHCKQSHVISQCPSLAALTLEERQSAIRSERLCFGCLGRGHGSRNCRRRAKCDTCSRRHPTLLHDENYKPKDLDGKKPDIKPQAADTKTATALNSHVDSVPVSQCISSMVVPVYLTNTATGTKSRLVYALLDSQSDSSFILDSTLDSFAVDTAPVTLNVSTMSGSDLLHCRKASGFKIQGHGCKDSISLPTLFSRPQIPHNRSHFPTPSFCQQFPHLKEVATKLLPLQDVEVGLLIGYNVNCQQPLQTVVSKNQTDPYAIKTPVGWCVIGSSVTETRQDQLDCNQVVCSSRSIIVYKTVAVEVCPRDVINMLERDFKDDGSSQQPISQDDRKFLEVTSQRKQLEDGRYEVPMPFKQESLVDLECNIQMAEMRLQYLKRKMERNPDFRDHYIEFMNENMELKFCEEVPSDEIDDRPAWYIPHHGVYHKVKKKIRVVYDCSARYKGKSLNDCLLTGPDLINNLTGVLFRFRKEQVAIQGDIKKMFHQFSVPPNQRNFLRYLWWKDGDTKSTPIHMRMTRHCFGAVSSMGCANIGLRAIADDYWTQYGKDCYDAVFNSFYVDDILHSVASPSNAVNLVERLCAMLGEGKVELAKFVSSSSDVLKALDSSLVSEKIKVDFSEPIKERALGVHWNVREDWFTFAVQRPPEIYTRRKILSVIATVFDPMGLVSPFVLLGKQILQECCMLGLDWDEPLPDPIAQRYKDWCSHLESLSDVQVPRCIKPAGFEVETAEFHHFADASMNGYGFCSYLRLIDSKGVSSVSLVFSKSRVSPIKPVTVPRLELTAATLAVRYSIVLEKEFVLNVPMKHFYYTDSTVVLGYISNSTRRYQTFVANRVGFIQTHTSTSQWNHIKGSDNPADIVSRGCTPGSLLKSIWFVGPPFLCVSGPLDYSPVYFPISSSDENVRKVALALKVESDFFKDRLSHISGFLHLLRVVSRIRKWAKLFKSKGRNVPKSYDEFSVVELWESEIAIVKLVQKGLHPLLNSSHLQQFSPYVDDNGVIRVGGRLKNMDTSYRYKHPILLPKDHLYTHFVVDHCHAEIGHGGRGFTLNHVRLHGYFILNGLSLVKQLIYKCVICRRLRAKPSVQQMSDLPEDRVSQSAPFTSVGCDFFGPFMVKSRRSQLKRYGCVFTCLYSRAIHIEVCTDLTSDAFIMALRRFIAIRGPVTRIRCDCGTNFVGASNELQQALESMKQDDVKEFLLKNGCDTEFLFNPPSASHFGGVFERQIGTIRKVLSGLLVSHSSQLTDECLSTLLHEVAAIINCRPLSLFNVDDPEMEPLTPNHLLTHKSKVIVSPPSEFVQADLYLKKRWRRVQHLANQFWTRWRQEYVDTLNRRSKWQQPKRNFSIGDIVLLCDENLPRNSWRLARVVEVQPSKDNLVRSVKIQLATSHLDKNGKRLTEPPIFTRPIHKLIPLIEM